MSISDKSHEAFHRGIAPFFALLSSDQTQKLAGLRGEAAVRRRSAELAEKANEGELSESELAEYEAYIDANNLLDVLQAEARFWLANCI